MRVALLLFCLCASTAALSAPIGETRYRLEGVRSFSPGVTYGPISNFADGEHLIRMGDIFQRIGIEPFDEQPFGLLEMGLPMSRAVGATRFAGALRVIEEEGTLWTPESDARVRLTEDDEIWWYSVVSTGDFLVCAGRGARFATLRAERSGDLVLVELQNLDAASAVWMAGDRYGGFAYASWSSVRGARVDSTGHVEPVGTYYTGRADGIESSPGLDHVYAAQDNGVVLYRVEGPGQLTPGKPLREKEGTENLSIWFDPERRVDRVAAAYEDSLFVFEVDESGSSSLLLADGFGDNGYGPNVVFLEPGHLYYADGTDRAWLRHGANLEHRREIELSQIQAEDLAVATSGDGWAEVDWDGMVSYGTNMQAGFSAPGSQLPGEFGGQIAINDTHIYTGKWIEGTQRFYTFERTSPPTPVDSLDVELTAWRFLPWSLERDFLVTDDAVLDLSDPGHPSLVGSVAPPPFTTVVSFDTRPFPGSETDLLLAQVLWLSSGTLALHRISREHGIEQIWTEPILYSGGCAFEDERDLLYRVEYSSVWVHDVSDPYQPLRIHKHLFFEEVYQPNGRSLFHLLCEGEILHVSARNHRPGYNYRREQIPVWFDGARFVPAGKSLHAPIELWRQYGYSGYLWFRGGHSSAILTFAPPPRARREECCWDGPPPFER